MYQVSMHEIFSSRRFDMTCRFLLN